MSSRRTEFSPRAARWLLPAAVFALAPKCLLCVLAYAGLGAAMGLGGPEICGASADSPVSWVSSLAWLGVAAGLGTLVLLASCRRCAGETESKTRREIRNSKFEIRTIRAWLI
jgi:hypothetical protein